MNKDTLPFKGKGETRTHAHLWAATKRMFELAEDEKNSQLRYMTMSSMLYCAFTMEAFLNHAGALLIKTWFQKEERDGPKQKLKHIEKCLETSFDLSKRPFQTLSDLFVYRNWLAHGKTEIILEPTIIKTSSGPDFEFESEWEKWTTYDNAKRFKEDTYSMMHKIHRVKRLESTGLEVLGGASYSSSERLRILGKE